MSVLVLALERGRELREGKGREGKVEVISLSDFNLFVLQSLFLKEKQKE